MGRPIACSEFSRLVESQEAFAFKLQLDLDGLRIRSPQQYKRRPSTLDVLATGTDAPVHDHRGQAPIARLPRSQEVREREIVELQGFYSHPIWGSAGQAHDPKSYLGDDFPTTYGDSIPDRVLVDASTDRR
jgi:hypothetical protein